MKEDMAKHQSECDIEANKKLEEEHKALECEHNRMRNMATNHIKKITSAKDKVIESLTEA